MTVPDRLVSAAVVVLFISIYVYALIAAVAITLDPARNPIERLFIGVMFVCLVIIGLGFLD